MPLLPLLLLSLAAALATAADPLPPSSFEHGDWDAVVRRHVNEAGEVDYAALKTDRARLDRYVEALSHISPDSRPELFPARAHQLAFWLNAYNALVTRGVVEAWPVRSVLDLGPNFGFFKRAVYTVGGRRLSLDIVEHRILRPRFRDPRIHFAIVCASIGCPRLAREAFTAADVDSQLDAVTRASLAEPRMVTIDARSRTLRLTSLFKWYAADFGPVAAFLRKYLDPVRAQQLANLGAHPRIRYFEYDWAVNVPGSRARAAAAAASRPNGRP